MNIRIFKSPSSKLIYIETVTSGYAEDFVYSRQGDFFTIDRVNTKVLEVSKASYSLFTREDGTGFADADAFESYLIELFTEDFIATTDEIEKNWETVSSNQTGLKKGKYNIKNITGNVDIGLDLGADVGAEWEFANTDYTLEQDSKEANIGLDTDFFQNELGEYQQGKLIIDTPNAHVKIIKVSSNYYDIVFDGVVDNISFGTTQTFLKSQSGTVPVPLSQGDVLSGLITVPFPQSFDNIPEVVLDYKWKYNATSNPTSLDPELHLENIGQGSFTFRFRGATNVLDELVWIAHDNNKVQKEVLNPNEIPVDLSGTGQNIILNDAENGFVRKQPVFYSGYWEVDQGIPSSVITPWNLSNPTRSLNSGIIRISNELEVSESGLYDITIGGGQSNNSAFNALVYSIIQIDTTGTYVNVAATTFRTLEIDGIGSKSGGGIGCSSIVQLNAGDRIRIVSSGEQASILHNKTITVKKIY